MLVLCVLIAMFGTSCLLLVWHLIQAVILVAESIDRLHEFFDGEDEEVNNLEYN